MKKDPAIEEIRAVRRKISRQFGNDSKALVAHYMELQEKYAGRLVAGPSAVHPTAVAKQAGTIRTKASVGYSSAGVPPAKRPKEGWRGLSSLRKGRKKDGAGFPACEKIAIAQLIGENR